MSNTIDKQLLAARQQSRRLILQALYQWQFTQDSSEELLLQFQQDESWQKADPDYFVELLNGILSNAKALSLSLSEHSDRPIDQIDPVEQAALLLASYEIVHRPDIPKKVAISEAIRLSKKFGAEDGHKFVNAMLDRFEP